MTPAESLEADAASWRALQARLAEQQPTPEEVLMREWRALHLSDYYLQPAALAAIRTEREAAAARLMAVERERDALLRELGIEAAP